jgi:IS5 family transposase
MKQMSLFAEDLRLARLSQMGDPLEKIGAAVNWELFRPTLEGAFEVEAKGPGGRPPLDRVMLFKILMLQQWNNIADDHAEYLINDRLSFQRFLGLSLGDRVPDAKSIWLFRDSLRKSGADKALFIQFAKQMEELGLITRSGSIVDAVFAESPRQHNTKEENTKIKAGGIPEEWEKPEKAHKLAQKDTDARWTKKRQEYHFGYKDHVKVDKASKLITEYAVTPASVHDNQVIEELVDERDQEIYADSAHDGEKVAKRITRKAPNAKLFIQRKANRGHPLTEQEKEENREKSKVRSRVEHVFGHMKMFMGGTYVRAVGIERVSTWLTLKNLAYNLSRYEILLRQPPNPAPSLG